MSPDLLPPWFVKPYNRDPGQADIFCASSNTCVLEDIPTETAEYIISLTLPKPRPERLSPLTRDPNRSNGEMQETGIFIRVQNADGSWGNADIAELDKASLLGFLRSRGGCNEWAENVVMALLGHD